MNATTATAKSLSFIHSSQAHILNFLLINCKRECKKLRSQEYIRRIIAKKNLDLILNKAPTLLQLHNFKYKLSKAWQLMQKDLRMKTDFVLPRSETRIFCNTFLRDIPWSHKALVHYYICSLSCKSSGRWS